MKKRNNLLWSISLLIIGIATIILIGLNIIGIEKSTISSFPIQNKRLVIEESSKIFIESTCSLPQVDTLQIIEMNVIIIIDELHNNV